MVRTAFTLGLGVAVVAVATSVPGRASLVSPDDPMAVPVRPDGTAEPLPFDEFRARYAVLANAADPRPGPDGKPNADRAKVLARVKARQQKKAPAADEVVALAADLVRLGNTDAGFFVNDALNLLAPRTRDRVPDYFVHTTLALAHAARGEWPEAVNYHDAALIDCEMPAAVKGWSAGQRAWLAGLDRTYVPHYLRLRRDAAAASPRPAPEDEDPTPLFPLPDKDRPADPVRWVNDAGEYEPGTLAAAERAKLPPDAIAVVQQLLLWFPSDTRLYWLLAELYAADGKLAEAQSILDEAAWSRQYGNRKKLMDHRTAVAAAVEARRPKPAEVPISLRTVWVYFGAVGAVAVLALVRALTRRSGGGRPRVG